MVKFQHPTYEIVFGTGEQLEINTYVALPLSPEELALVQKIKWLTEVTVQTRLYGHGPKILKIEMVKDAENVTSND